MLAQVPAPPMPSGPALVAGGVVFLAVGLALVIRGRSNGRGILALLAAAGAAAAAPLIVALIPALGSVALTAVAAAVTAGLMALVLGRLLWALLLGAILGVVALTVGAWLGAGNIAQKPAFPPGQIDSVAIWCRHLGAYLTAWAWATWQHNIGAVSVAGGLATLGVVVGALLPKITMVVTSSAVGAVAASAGATMLLWSMRLGWTERVILPAALAATAVTALGVGFQSWRQFGAASEPLDKGKSTKPGSADRSKKGSAT